MWSVGCIFAELLSMQRESVPNFTFRMPLFPGRSCYPMSPHPAGNKTSGNKAGLNSDQNDQLSVIFSVLGSMSADDIAAVSNPDVRRYLSDPSCCRHQQPSNLQDNFPGAEPEAIELLKGT